MAESSEVLDREARIFAAALIGAQLSDAVLRQYRRAHDALPLAPSAGFDATLVTFARLGAPATRMADAYARFVAPGGALRRKLTLLLAVLESTAPFDASFAPVAASPLGTVARLAWTGVGAAVYAVLGTITLGPLHLAGRLGGRP